MSLRLVRSGSAFFFLLLAFFAASEVTPEPIDRCGHLYEWEGCIRFYPTDSLESIQEYGTDLTSIPDSPEYGPIRVRGEVSGCSTPCGYPWICIAGAVASPCEPVDLGCGVLHFDPYDGCHTWHSPIYGTLQTGMYGHSDGDTVGVVGVIDYGTPTVCMNGAALFFETIYDCDSLTTVTRTTWGTLKSIFKE